MIFISQKYFESFTMKSYCVLGILRIRVGCSFENEVLEKTGGHEPILEKKINSEERTSPGYNTERSI